MKKEENQKAKTGEQILKIRKGESNKNSSSVEKGNRKLMNKLNIQTYIKQIKNKSKKRN